MKNFGVVICLLCGFFTAVVMAVNSDRDLRIDSVEDFVISDSVLYAVDGYGRLHVLDFSGTHFKRKFIPLSVTRKDERIRRNANRILVKEKILVVRVWGAIEVFNIDDPWNPIKISQSLMDTYSQTDMMMLGGAVFIGQKHGGLGIFEVLGDGSNGRNLDELNRLELPGVLTIESNGRSIFVGTEDGLFSFRTNPWKEPVPVQLVKTTPVQHLEVVYPYVFFVYSGVKQQDSDLLAVSLNTAEIDQVISIIELPKGLGPVKDIELVGCCYLLIGYNDRIDVYDYADKENPVLHNTIDQPKFAQNMDKFEPSKDGSQLFWMHDRGVAVLSLELPASSAPGVVIEDPVTAPPEVSTPFPTPANSAVGKKEGM